MPESKLQLSMRTIKKVILHLELGCSICGWDLASCDIHHIVEQCNGGTNDHSNLTLLCPNCHRLAHRGITKKFKTLENQFNEVGEGKVFEGLSKFSREARVKAKTKFKSTERADAKYLQIEDRKARIFASGIDFKKRGWQTALGNFLDISPQKTVVWMKKYMTEFLGTCH
jgi:hypothetical protein